VDPRRWWNLWQLLCRRFDRECRQDEAAAYLEYLDALLTPEEIEAAARAVWADREYFPRPADFLLAAHASVLARLRAAAREWNRDRGGRTWDELLGPQGSMARRVLRELGGVDHVSRLLDRGPLELRREVEHAVSQLLRVDAAQLPPLLPANEQRNLLKP
jgi:hypothetical protein